MICGGKDCIYRAPLSSSITNSNTFCDKLSHSKPSTLKWFYDLYGIDRMDEEHWKIWAETECPFYTQDPKKEKTKSHRPKFNEEKALALYKNGESDAEIARALNSNTSAVGRWRQANNLKANRPHGRRVYVDEKAIAELYAQGLPDYKIARELCCGEKYVADWRKDRDLTPNHVMTVRVDYELVAQLYEHGLTDGAIAERAGCHLSTISAWRYKNHLEPNFGGRRRKNL